MQDQETNSYFMDRKINFSLNDAAGQSFRFEHLRALYEFILQERDFWGEQRNRIQPTLNGSPAQQKNRYHP